MSKTQSFSKESPEMEAYLKQQTDPRARLAGLRESLANALEKPDGPLRPAADPVQLHPNSQPPAVVQHPAVAQSPAVVQQPAGQPVVAQPPAVIQPQTDAMSLTVPEKEPGRNGRPLHGKKPKIEKTFAIDDEIHRQLVRISNHEGIRHDKKFSVSFIMNHLLDFALAHVEGTNVIPDDQGIGLVIPGRGEAQ